MTAAAQRVSATDHPGARHEEARLTPLDGVRGLAILLVVIHNAGGVHGGRDSLPLKLWAIITNAGWVGVQLFFALSGFLITSILLESRGRPGYYKSFYARRALRIMPLYYAFLIFIIFIAPHFQLFSPLVVTTPPSTAWYWTYLTNWIEPFADMPPALVHLWSLAVEEQFYLAWPLVVAALANRKLMWWCMAIIVSSLLFRLSFHEFLSTNSEQVAAYTFTIARWDAIALGAIVAIIARDANLRAKFNAHIGLLLTLSAVVAVTVIGLERGLPAVGTIGERIGQPLAGVVSALLVLACVLTVTEKVPNKSATVLAGVFSVRWLRLLGKYSYAIYLFQTPVRLVLLSKAPAVFDSGTPTERFWLLMAFIGIVLGVSWILALITWRILEAPILRLKRYFPRP